MNAELRGRKGLERSRDFHIWKVLGGGGALRGLKHLTYDSVVCFYFRYPLLTLALVSSNYTDPSALLLHYGPLHPQ